MTAHPIGRIAVTDPLTCQDHAREIVALADQSGGRVLVNGRPQTVLEGDAPERSVIIECPDRQSALDWCNSDAHRARLPRAHAAGQRDIVIVDGS